MYVRMVVEVMKMKNNSCHQNSIKNISGVVLQAAKADRTFRGGYEICVKGRCRTAEFSKPAPPDHFRHLDSSNSTASPAASASQLQPLILCKQLRDLRINRLLFAEVRTRIPPLNQILDLMLNPFLLRLRLPAFTYIVFIVHPITLTPSSTARAARQ